MELGHEAYSGVDYDNRSNREAFYEIAENQRDARGREQQPYDNAMKLGQENGKPMPWPDGP
jgi:hypothetical protein